MPSSFLPFFYNCVADCVAASLHSPPHTHALTTIRKSIECQIKSKQPSLASAKKRGAKIYCELAGYGASCDAYHITTPAPEGRGLANAMERALKGSGVKKEDVNYINAHGTSTAYNDKFETMAIKSVFGEHATKKDGTFVVSSTKGATGHTLGAAGGIEAVVAALAISEGSVPPTINLEESDPDCDLDYVPNEKRTMEVNAAMSTNLGFGGHNAALLFKKYL